ncbi:MAG: SusC/RagA family TonB-linked outer membrane protein, partial [Flavisolibacter sp.]|nr:SusC/RagA family TonB-linked outer membrane protein [Flavisolibacter sp.]
LFILLGVFVMCSQLLAQNRTITGKVTDNNGNGIPASVTVKGTTIGTATAADGSFTISVPANGRILVITSVGFQAQELTIGTQTSVSVSLATDNAGTMEEVIVTVPYGQIRKTSFTGAENTVTAKTLQRQQVTSVTRALEGNVPGLSATSGGGRPGTGADIRIRGIGSINASASPLYVLNGVPYDGSIAAINMDDIESVTVLKDAAAAALYGSRAANGVIMITTKKGRKGAPMVSANLRQGFMSRGIPEYDRVGTGEYYELMWEAARNSYLFGSNPVSRAQAGIQASNVLTGTSGLVYNAYNVPGNQLVDPATGKLNPSAQLLWNDSWEDALFQTAPRTNATISMSGVGDRNDYFISFGYLNEEGTVKNTGYKRYNTRLNVNNQPTTWLNTGLQVDGAMATRKRAIGETGGTAGSSAFFFSRNIGPIYPVYHRDKTTGAIIDTSSLPHGNLDWGTPAQMGTRPYLGLVNPLGALLLDVREDNIFNGNVNTFAEIKFLKDFALRGTLGVNMYSENSTDYQNSLFGDAASNRGRSTKSTDRTLSLTGNQVLSWSKTLNRHYVRALAGHENYKYRNNYLSGNKTGFAYYGFTELDNGTEIFGQPRSYENEYRIESYFGALNYELDQKYLFSASYRTDGSSRFADSVRWGNFYSAGIGWRISQESFLRNVGWINELKLRASYGEQGNENLGGLYYSFRTYYNADLLGGYSGPTRPGNPDLRWETNKNLNIGLDFTILKNRLQGTIEYFTRASSNLLFDVPLPPSTPYSSVYRNIGAMKNTGWELSLGYNAIRAANFDWRVDMNLTSYKNEVTELPPGASSVNGIIRGTQRLFPGKSIYEFWLREYAGVDASTGDALYYRDILGSDGKPTGEKVLTNNYANASLYYHGSSLPKIQGGLTNGFRYRGFDLSVLTTFAFGAKFYDANYAGLMHRGTYGQALHTDIQQRWTKPGDVT